MFSSWKKIAALIAILTVLPLLMVSNNVFAGEDSSGDDDGDGGEITGFA